MKGKEVITQTEVGGSRVRRGAERGERVALGRGGEAGSLTSAERCGAPYRRLFTVSPAEAPRRPASSRPTPPSQHTPLHPPSNERISVGAALYLHPATPPCYLLISRWSE